MSSYACICVLIRLYLCPHIDEKDVLCLCFFEFSHDLEKKNILITLLLAVEEVAFRQMCVPKPLSQVLLKFHEYYAPVIELN